MYDVWRLSGARCSVLTELPSETSSARRLPAAQFMVNHTPANELVRVRVGEAFDLVGERKQTDFKKPTQNVAEESFEIAVRNQKKDQEVEVRVVEHLYRWFQWEIIEKSQDFVKTDARTAEFRVKVPPGEERKVTYRVRYSW